MSAIRDWTDRGGFETVEDRGIFVVDLPAIDERAEPIVILHGFPSCSFDWRHVVDAMRRHRRVIAFDMLGYGLSDKPKDHRYSLFEQADLTEELVRGRGLDAVALATHDMGDSVGGELLARSMEGSLAFDITARLLSNGSIYMDLVALSAGQELLLALPDEVLDDADAPDEALLTQALAATFGPTTQPNTEEIDAQWRLLARDGGNRLLPRLIRYIEERRVHEPRWTTAIERHPSPLTIVWGDADPIALFPMAERLGGRAAGSRLVWLKGIGHYPMIEDPSAFAEAAARAFG